MTTVRLLVVSESTSTSSTVGCHCELAQIGTLGVTEGEPDDNKRWSGKVITDCVLDLAIHLLSRRAATLLTDS